MKAVAIGIRNAGPVSFLSFSLSLFFASLFHRGAAERFWGGVKEKGIGVFLWESRCEDCVPVFPFFGGERVTL